jgi:hypothetical protein
MEVALTHRGITFERQKELHVFFEGVDVGVQRLDLVVGDQNWTVNSPRSSPRLGLCSTPARR